MRFFFIIIDGIMSRAPSLRSIRKHSNGAVIVSKSNDIFTNLALEDWMYSKWSFANRNVLLLWQNEPCVVIGRHQNPWLEANFVALDDAGVKLARRNSGGGAVYHDLGNLNLTFFTCRDLYDRKRNLKLITKVLERDFDIKASISSREDIVVGESKVSGTASKLGRLNAYHHCTLLVDAKKENLSLSLKKTGINIRTNATKSISSKIKNLKDERENLTVAHLMRQIGKEFAHNFEFVDPTEENYPGLRAIFEKFTSWDWIYGKTPTFTLSTAVPVPIDLCDNKNDNLIVNVVVEKGIIQNISVSFPPGLSSNEISGEAKIPTGLEGEKFDKNTISHLEVSITDALYGKEGFFRDFLKRII